MDNGQFSFKCRLTLGRLGYFFTSFTKRLVRLGRHLVSPFRGMGHLPYDYPKGIYRYGLWLMEIPFFLLDLIGIGEIYGTLADWIKFGSRPLTPQEIELGKSVYGETVRFDLITIDERAYIGPKRMLIAYVSFHTINSWGGFSRGLLLHEFVHNWQYERYGSVYIFRALLAQHSRMKYDYGGLPMLKKAKEEKWPFDRFNYEQQGDIVQDYYLVGKNISPCWGTATMKDIRYYEYFIHQLDA